MKPVIINDFYDPTNNIDARIRTALGLEFGVYHELFDRRYLMTGDRWSDEAAAEAAMQICYSFTKAPFVLFGARVTRAFGISFEPFAVVTPHPWVLCLPEPSDPAFNSSSYSTMQLVLSKLYPAYSVVAGEKKRRDPSRLGL